MVTNYVFMSCFNHQHIVVHSMSSSRCPQDGLLEILIAVGVVVDRSSVQAVVERAVPGALIDIGQQFLYVVQLGLLNR